MTTCRQGLWAPPLGRSRLLVCPDRLATYLWVLTDVFDRSARSSEAARGNDQMPIGTSHSCYAISPRSCKKRGRLGVRPPRETGGSGRRGGQFGPPYNRDYMPQAQQELAGVVIRPRRPWPRHARAEDRNFGSSGRRAVGQKWVNICAVGQPWVNIFESLRARDEMTSDTSDDPTPRLTCCFTVLAGQRRAR